jgi:ATP synthase protein I
MRKDMGRFRAREEGHRTFWRSLSVLGGVGWPIVLLTAGGAILGHYLDRQWHTGLHMTLILLFVGVILGSAAAWHLVQGTRS